jgi:flagellin-like hook-associated protein FlgL
MSADTKTAAELAKLAREINRVHKEITEAAQTSIQRSELVPVV